MKTSILLLGIIITIVGVILTAVFPYVFWSRTPQTIFGVTTYYDTPNLTFMYIGIPLATFGSLLIIGWYVSYSKRKFDQLATPHTPAPPPGPPCSTCNQPLEYVQTYQKWYCRNCKKYE